VKLEEPEFRGSMMSELAIDRHTLRVNLLIGRCNKEAL
jgi:hypothetical protein